MKRPSKTTYQVTEEHIKKSKAINDSWDVQKDENQYKMWQKAQKQEVKRYAKEFRKTFITWKKYLECHKK